MKKLSIIFTLFLCVFLVCTPVLSVKAYTEEEKQMAKDWLSSHGYSPDMSGANQAYSDYLNGMYDDYGNPVQPDTEAPETEAPKKKKKSSSAQTETNAPAPEPSEASTEPPTKASESETQKAETTAPTETETAAITEKPTEKETETVAAETTDALSEQTESAASIVNIVLYVVIFIILAGGIALLLRYRQKH